MVPEGVAVLADGFWPAKGSDASRVTWDKLVPRPGAAKKIISQYIDAAQTEGARARNEGDVTNTFSQANKTMKPPIFFPISLTRHSNPMTALSAVPTMAASS